MRAWLRAVPGRVYDSLAVGVFLRWLKAIPGRVFDALAIGLLMRDARPWLAAMVSVVLIGAAVCVGALAVAAQAGKPSARPASRPAACQSAACRARVWHKHQRRVVRPYRAWLARLARCESSGDYRAVSPLGTYTGAFQFDAMTWRSVGGRGIALYASRLEQRYRAVRLRWRRGTAPWPVCGQR